MRAVMRVALLAVAVATTPTHARRVVVYHRDANAAYIRPGRDARVVAAGRRVTVLETPATESSPGQLEEEDKSVVLFAVVAAKRERKRAPTRTPTRAPTTPATAPSALRESVLGLGAATAATATGLGVRVYVLDSGCLASHPEFAHVSVALGPSYISSEPDVGEDALGHGTSVLSAAVQIAPESNYTCVRVFSAGDSGSSAGLALAVDWVVGECVPKAKAKTKAGAKARCIINLSGGGSASAVLDAIANDAVAAGIAFVAAAGNYVDSCDYSPGRAVNVLGAGATSVAVPPAVPVFEASFSAYGKCVKVLAPGWGDITASSAYPGGAGAGGNPAYVPVAGTSFASPLVAGTLAMTWQLNPYLTALEVQELYVDGLRSGMVRDVPDGTANAYVTGPRPGATLGRIDASPYFEQWRGEWALRSASAPGSCRAVRATAVRATLWQMTVAYAAAPPAKFRPHQAANNTLVLAANGRGLALKVDGVRVALVGDSRDVTTRTVLVADGVLVVAALMPHGAWITQLAYELPPHVAAATTLLASFANALYDPITSMPCATHPFDRVQTRILPPCHKRSAKECSAVTAAYPKTRCLWRGVHYKCKTAAWCGFATRNACAAAAGTCRWEGGRCMR